MHDDMHVEASKSIHALCLHLDVRIELPDSAEEDPAWGQLAGDMHPCPAI